MNNATHTANEQATLDRYQAGLVNGAVLARIEVSHKSVPVGGPAITARAYGKAMATLGTFAAQDDWSASVAAQVFGHVNRYSTANEVVAQIAGRLSGAAASGFYDTITATGPEAGRPSSHQHPTTVRRGILLALLMIEIEKVITESGCFLGSVPKIGWCLADLMKREGITVDAQVFPHLAA